MVGRILFVFPLLLSCSIFENEQDFEIDPTLLINDWRIESFYNDLELIEPNNFDSTVVESAFRFEIFPNNNCELYGIKPRKNSFHDCKWEIYGSQPKVYLRIYFSEYVHPWYFDSSFLYQVFEISHKQFKIKFIGHRVL